MRDKQGENLIFLISQPRSGSTLLQHMLGSHSKIHTLPEPWFMLPLVYIMRESGCSAEYNSAYARLALSDYLKRIPDGKKTYCSAVCGMASTLYEKALEGTDKSYFLDKTPRYYHIIPELKEIFPKAKFILLIRNPLAVLLSILDVNFSGEWTDFSHQDRLHDVLLAPKLILNGIAKLGDQAVVVHYEKLVANPQAELMRISGELGLAFEDGMDTYGDKVKFENTTFVDPKSIYKHSASVPDYIDGWKKRLNTAERRQMAREYLERLGKQTVDAQGYSYDALLAELNTDKKVHAASLISWAMLEKDGENFSSKEKGKLALYNLMRGYGIGRAVKRVIRNRLATHLKKEN